MTDGPLKSAMLVLGRVVSRPITRLLFLLPYLALAPYAGAAEVIDMQLRWQRDAPAGLLVGT